jgi:hypothetical protein
VTEIDDDLIDAGAKAVDPIEFTPYERRYIVRGVLEAVHDRIAASGARDALLAAADQCERDATDGHCESPTCAENNRITAAWLRNRAESEAPR